MQKKLKTQFVLACSILLIFNLVSVSAITGSMGNAKMILYPEVNGWFTTTIEKTILVKNVNDIPIDIKLETDSDGSEFIEIIDEEFSLEPGAEKKAEFLVKVKKPGRYEGRVNVFFSTELEGEGPGVVLSSQVIVVAEKASDYEEDSEEDSEEINPEDEGVSITGKATSENKEKSSTGLGFLSVTTIILLGILIYLGIVMKNKSKKLNSKNKKGKVNKK